MAKQNVGREGADTFERRGADRRWKERRTYTGEQVEWHGPERRQAERRIEQQRTQ